MNSLVVVIGRACFARFSDAGRRLLNQCVGLLALGLAIAFGASPAWSADFPTRTIRIVVDTPPGAVGDIYARLLGRHLSEELGQPVVIEKKSGASGVLAVEEVLKAAPDGHTILYGGASSLVVLPAAGGRTRYDPKSSFIPTALGTVGYPLIALSSRHEVHSLNGLLVHARSAATPLTCGTTGIGSITQFACAMLARALGIKVTMVPYKGSTFAMQDAAAGHIDMVPAYPSELSPFLDSEKLRALAVLGPDRIARAAMVPTMAELGFAGHELLSFAGFYYPAGTSSEIVQAMNRAAVKAMQKSDIVERLNMSGASSLPLDAKDFAAFVAAQQIKWKQLADSAGIKVESN